MVSLKDLKQLLSRELDLESPVLSVYLDVDQRLALNLNRGFEAVLKSLLQGAERRLEPSQRKVFQEDARMATGFVSDYEPEGKSLVLFCDLSASFLWHRSLQVNLESAVHWGPRPFVRPLLEARDEFDRYGVVLTDRAHARLFKVFLGEIEEQREALAEADVKHFDASSSDQMRSQMHFQRKADGHARWHLKNVAEMVEKLAGDRKVDRLVLGGAQEAVAELKGLLSDYTRRSVVGAVSLPIEASENEILAETINLQERAEREEEKTVVQKLLTAAAKNQQAVMGLLQTLAAVQEGRVRELLYTDGYRAKGMECPECDEFFDESVEKCPYCRGELTRTADLLDAIVARVVRDGGEVELVRGGAAEVMSKSGEGIGAYLRF
jgi:hypothetical protein